MKTGTACMEMRWRLVPALNRFRHLVLRSTDRPDYRPVICIILLQYGEDDYDMGDDDYDDYSKELNQYRKSKDRGRGEFKQYNTLLNRL